MRKVSIYIEETRESNNYSELELFKDEEININLSVQNVKDISKVFTDFTQSFTVPASSINNSLLRHYYENAVDLDAAEWDNRLRINAYIEINRIPFRNGKVEIEKANIVNGRVESYTITFYGTLVNLKDTFGEDKLSDLDYTSIDFAYTGAEVYNRITDDVTDYDIRYPLISSDRLWSYGDSTSTDISVTGGAIDYTELFPAVKVPKIFDLIESKYGITFNGLYLTDERFNDLFLYYKSKKFNDTFSDKQVIDIIGGDTQYYNKQLNEAEVTKFLGTLTARLTLNITSVSSIGVKYYIDVYKDGTLQQTLEGSDVGIYYLGDAPGKYKCYIYSNANLTITSEYEWVLPFFGTSYYSTNDPNVLSSSSNLTGNAPNMKIADFVSGILKMFNLTCTAQNVDTFLIEPLDWWYQKGAIVDITKYVDEENVDVKKVPLYKRLNFKYQESKSFASKEFELRTGKSYGDLESNFEFSGDEYTIDVPFENLVQNKYTGTTIQAGFCLDENYNSYIPKPILLYQKPKRTTGSSIKFNNGTSTVTLNDYIGLSQTTNYNGYYYSLNFAPEQSQYYDIVVENTLYKNYYSSYLNNLFSYKNRLVSVRCILPISLLTGIRLNDRLIIRDKRYTINNIKSNLNTGEVQLELLSDFREIANDNAIEVTSDAGSIDLPVNMLNNSTTVSFSTTSAGVTFSSATASVDSYVTVSYPVNPNLGYELISEDEAADEVVSEDGFYTLQNEQSLVNVIEIDYTFTLTNGESVVNKEYIIQAEI